MLTKPIIVQEAGTAKRKRLVLIDGHSILFRAFHAYPPLTTYSGELVNAVYGFTSILLSLIRELEPSYIAVAFDRPEPTFRHKQYKGYKASRPKPPEELIKQQERVREIVEILNIPIFEKAGFEGDDLIGTLAKQAEKKKGDLEAVVVTSDRDLLQLVDNDKVKVYIPARGKQRAVLWNADKVMEKHGLTPEQLIDFKALAGDAFDEIPGVRGIGLKTATKLLQQFGGLESIYKNLSKVRGELGESVYQSWWRAESLQ